VAHQQSLLHGANAEKLRQDFEAKIAELAQREQQRIEESTAERHRLEAEVAASQQEIADGKKQIDDWYYQMEYRAAELKEEAEKLQAEREKLRKEQAELDAGRAAWQAHRKIEDDNLNQLRSQHLADVARSRALPSRFDAEAQGKIERERHLAARAAATGAAAAAEEEDDPEEDLTRPAYRASTLKEAETIKLPALPSATNARDWAAEIVSTLKTSAGANRDACGDWAIKAFQPERFGTSELLVVPKCLESINEKCMRPLLKLLQEPMATKWKDKATDALLDTGKILSVLPIFREILDNLKASPTTEALYASAALFALKFEGDSHMETFLNVFIKTHQKSR